MHTPSLHANLDLIDVTANLYRKGSNAPVKMYTTHDKCIEFRFELRTPSVYNYTKSISIIIYMPGMQLYLCVPFILREAATKEDVRL